MIIGCCVENQTDYNKYVQKSADRIGVKKIEKRVGQKSIFEAYNSILHSVRNSDNLILMHDDVEILDRDIVQKIANVFKIDKRVAIVGVAGAKDIKSIQWWDSQAKYGKVTHKADTGEQSILTFKEAKMKSIPFVYVDVVDGLLMAFNREYIKKLSFDESNFEGFHGYDVDICLQARRDGLKTAVINTEVTHHTFLGIKNPIEYAKASEMINKKWTEHGYFNR